MQRGQDFLSRDTIRRTREEGEKLYGAIGRERYANTAGLKLRTHLSEIFRRYEEFRDPGLFLSLSAGYKEESEAGSHLVSGVTS